ncbi:hypothetical protein ACFV24_19395, partial [Nocardia fluminea]|uniref:hypothetical protein n=1 Tax=Nocardia fluminea TaxID=134984 RepID=UPI00366F83E8
MADPRAAHDMLVTFWRRRLAPLPTAAIDGFLDMNVPEPAPDAHPEHLIAYAELVAAVSNPGLATAMDDIIRHRGTPGIRDERRLLFDVADACVAVTPLVVAGHSPRPGPELDRYVEVHASARDRRDTPSFRRRLLADAAGSRVRRYWHLTTTLTGEVATTGTTQLWLFDALTVSMTGERGGGGASATPPTPRPPTQSTRKSTAGTTTTAR